MFVNFFKGLGHSDFNSGNSVNSVTAETTATTLDSDSIASIVDSEELDLIAAQLQSPPADEAPAEDLERVQEEEPVQGEDPIPGEAPVPEDEIAQGQTVVETTANSIANSMNQAFFSGPLSGTSRSDAPLSGAVAQQESTHPDHAHPENIHSDSIPSDEAELSVATPITVLPQGTGTLAVEESGLEGEAMTVFIRQAKAYMKQEQWEKAIAACEEALAVAPDVAEAHKLIGNILQEMGHGIDSMAHYARALLANPRFPEVYANLGSLYARQQEWDDAALYYQKAINLRPCSEFYRPMAKILEVLGKTDAAADALAQALVLSPEAGTAAEHFRVANFWLKEGEEVKAIASYRRAIEVDSSFVAAYRPLADLLEKQGDWQAATLYYRKVLEAGISINPEGAIAQTTPKNEAVNPVQTIPNGHQLLQKLLQESKQLRSRSNRPTDASAEGVRRDQVLQPTGSEALQSAENYARSGQLQAEEKNWARAIEYYQQSLRLNPEQPAVYRELARALTQANRREAAALAWFEAFKREPSWASAEQYFNLANALVKQGQLDSAKVCFRQAVRLQPKMAIAYEYLGRVLETQGDQAGALVAYRKALEVQGQGQGATVAKKS